MRRTVILTIVIILFIAVTQSTWAWNPPPIDSPIKVSDTDEDPWGDTNLTPSRCLVNDNDYTVIENNTKLIGFYALKLTAIMQYLSPMGPYFVFNMKGHRNIDVNDLDDNNRECREFGSTRAVPQSNDNGEKR